MSALSDYEHFNQILPVSRGTHEKLRAYAELLKKWQQKINLISKSDSEGEHLWHRHILDSAQLFCHIPPNTRLIDLGSGAGFPGLILSIMGVGEVHLVESDGRKSAFLLEAARSLGLGATIHVKRIEEIAVKGFDVVTSRGLTALTDLIAYAHPLMGEGAICLFHKGKKYSMELDEAKAKWVFDHQTHQSITDPEGVILALSRIRDHG